MKAHMSPGIQCNAVTECTIEFFDSRRLKINIDTLDVALHLPDKKFGDGTLRLRALLDRQQPFLPMIWAQPSSWTRAYPVGHD